MGTCIQQGGLFYSAGKRVVKKQNKTYQTNAELHRFFTVSKISDAELITCQQNSHMMSKTELVQQQQKKTLKLRRLQVKPEQCVLSANFTKSTLLRSLTA